MFNYFINNLMIDDDKFCYWKDLRNTQLQWYSTDSESKYQENLKNNYSKLQKHGWIDSVIHYTFNSHGFRCSEFTNDQTILFLGCSVTVGVGLPDNQIFPNLVSNRLNLRCANLGVQGSSADLAFRLSQIYLQKLQPKIVVSTLLFPTRLELLTSNCAYSFTPNMKATTQESKKNQVNYYEIWLQQKENTELNFLKNQLAISQTCNQYNIKHITLTIQEIENFNCGGKNYTKARDLIHPGYLQHQYISQLILNKI